MISARRERLGGTILLAVLALGAAPLQHEHRVGKHFDAVVVVVADGDTLELIPSGEKQRIRIRLEGIDAPELGEPFSREARAFLRTVLAKPSVRVEGRDVDRYGRLVARVSASGRDVSTELLRAGLACQRFAADRLLADAESAARAAGLGFWAAAALKPRCVGLRQPTSSPRVASAAPLRGNVGSGVYHVASCPNYTCRNCTRVFATESEARGAGFRPSPDCVRR